MWSGPRNLSTAMMYSFGARSDCDVADEPFYAAYLAATGLEHPMRDEILASQPTIGADVARQLSDPVSAQKPHFYQKHMTHHLLPETPKSWMSGVKNVFLIRHPARVVSSYARKREGPSLTDLGFVEQVALFDHVCSLGQVPVVIDSADVRADPERALKALCAAIGLEWDAAMLHWAAGGHAQDGVWAKHWYGAVHRSTGFAEPEGELPKVPNAYLDLIDQALPYYRKLENLKLG